MLPSDSKPQFSPNGSSGSSEFEDETPSDSGDQSTVTSEPETVTSLCDESDANDQMPEETKVEILKRIDELRIMIETNTLKIASKIASQELKIASNEVALSKINLATTSATQVGLAQNRTIPDVDYYADFWMDCCFKQFKELPQLNSDIMKWRNTFNCFFQRYEILEQIIRFDLNLDGIKATSELRRKFGLSSRFNDENFQEFLSGIVWGLNAILIGVSGEQYNKELEETLQMVIREIYDDYHTYYFDKVSAHVNEYLKFNYPYPEPSDDLGRDVQIFFTTLDYCCYLRYFSHLSIHDGAFNHLLWLVAKEFKKYSNGEKYNSLDHVYELLTYTDEYHQWENKYKKSNFGEIFSLKFDQNRKAAKSNGSHNPNVNSKRSTSKRRNKV